MRAVDTVVLRHRVDFRCSPSEGLVQATVGLLHGACDVGEGLARKIGQPPQFALEFRQLHGAGRFVGALQRILRQGPHLLADHGEAPAGIASARRLDGCIERQHANGVADLGNAGQHLLQFRSAIAQHPGDPLEPFAHVALGLSDAALHLPHEIGDGLVRGLELAAASRHGLVQGTAPALHLCHQLAGGIAGRAGVVEQVQAVAQELRRLVCGNAIWVPCRRS